MSEARSIQPRRNLLFVPGTRPDRLPKALTATKNMVTVDLEDAVIPPQKDMARGRALTAWFESRRDDRIEHVVRINGLRTPFGLKDLLAIVEHPSPPDAIMLPKVVSADEVGDRRCGPASTPRRRVGLHVIIESNPGLEAVQAIAGGGSARSARCCSGRSTWRPSSGRRRISPRCSMPAAGWCMPPQATASMRSTCPGSTSRTRPGWARKPGAVRDLGFTGKAAIHPKQLAPINAVFTAGARSDRLCPQGDRGVRGRPRDGLVVVDGKLIELPVVRSARRTLATAAATGAL